MYLNSHPENRKLSYHFFLVRFHYGFRKIPFFQCSNPSRKVNYTVHLKLQTEVIHISSSCFIRFICVVRRFQFNKLSSSYSVVFLIEFSPPVITLYLYHVFKMIILSVPAAPLKSLPMVINYVMWCASSALAQLLLLLKHLYYLLLMLPCFLNIPLIKLASVTEICK